VRTKEGKLCLFIAIDRTAYAELHDKSISQTASRVLHSLIKAVAYEVYTVLTEFVVGNDTSDIE